MSSSVQASERVGDIEARMNGTINKKKGLPLSVEGQVSHLIKVRSVYARAVSSASRCLALRRRSPCSGEVTRFCVDHETSSVLAVTRCPLFYFQEATDENNLCRMYIGWAAYM